VPQVAGKVGNAASITTANNFLWRADNALFDFSAAGMSVAMWVYFPTALPANTIDFANKYRVANDWRLYWNVGNTKFGYNVYSTGSPSLSADTFGAPSANTWYLLVATADNTNIKISVNAGTQDSVAQGGTIPHGAEDFRIGSIDFDGNYYADQVGLWNRALTPAEITQLYNAGAGLAYSAM